MFASGRIVALFSLLSVTALASDVYSSFNDSEGNQIGTTNFDVSNTGCFTVAEAVEINFTQAGGTHTANGPYCLTGWSDGGCTGAATSQQFEDVEVNNGHTYELDDGLVSVGSYSWSAIGC